MASYTNRNRIYASYALINLILDTIAMDRIKLEDLECYFAEYLATYRREYEKFVSAPPLGPGYPKLTVSPYLGEAKFDVYLSTTGIIVNQTDVEPAYKWYIAGGPALKVDYEPTVTPIHVSEILKANDLVGKNIGIYRIVAKKTLPNKVWKGRIEGIIRSRLAENLVEGISVNFYELNIHPCGVGKHSHFWGLWFDFGHSDCRRTPTILDTRI